MKDYKIFLSATDSKIQDKSRLRIDLYDNMKIKDIEELKNFNIFYCSKGHDDLVSIKGNLTIANASEFSSLNEDNQKVILDIINNKIELNKQEAIELKNKLKELEKSKESEIKNRQSIIEENTKLKAKLDNNKSKSEEEIKQIEGQLRVEVKKKNLIINMDI